MNTVPSLLRCNPKHFLRTTAMAAAMIGATAIGPAAALASPLPAAAFPVPALVYPVPALASSVAKAIMKYFGKEGAGEASEYLTRQGGKELMERVAANAARDGGDQAVQKVAALAGKYGPDALAALDNAPSVGPILKALDDLPADQVGAAIAKLSAGATGRELADATIQFGSKALTSELKHPGVGLVMVRSLGDDGAELASRMNSDQAIAVARHAEDLAKLPPTQRDGVLAVMRQDTTRMVQFLGRFAEANPGKSLFTVATTTVILAQPDRILGGDEIIFDADGNPIVVSKSGLAGRTLAAGGSAVAHVSESYIRPLYLTALAFFTTFAVLWAGLKLWQIHRTVPK
ncbi:hypothetical protein K227x_48140 [Rubripirellula lacrimiformis]|uniref:Uncharacterized protein n=1 Tax=Rubripirellula lacrimiformis TaxID=1930273 RepID=A0A517NH00_9BACT|nr:hypothetical protein [Rubripirellula lacrimiformis]QDT06405.1 hypothetical protein K227x_48140 [Rubripirellula lacrimiformis]